MIRWFSLITLILLISSSKLFSQVDLSKGLMAYYPFNGNANDASGNGNNPIFNNATLTSDFYGHANSAYHFNGVDNYMEIPNSSSLNAANTISICAWVKPTGFYYGACHGNSVLMKGNSDFLTGNYFLRFDDALYTGTNCNGGIPDTIHQTYYGIGTGLSPIQDTPFAQKNIWRSVVYTYDGLHARLYIDCNLVLDTKRPGLSFTNGDDLFLGKLNNGQFPYWLNGDLDEVRIYNRAITADEVKAYSYTCADKSPCSNWAHFDGIDPGVQIGDLDIPGNKITVEALFNRTDAYAPGFYGGDIVSKHTDPTDVNYLLRPTRAEITTTTGWHGTPDVCDFKLNKTYYVAMVYDGQSLKFYRNGFLMSQTPCTGNLVLNDWITRIGSTAAPLDQNPSDFHGYINEVRIWNVARSQNELKAYMNVPLPNPSSQNGLLAYYTFDDLKNKQGNSQWDGSLLNNVSINQTNSNCDFVADSCDNVICDLKADFTYKQNTCDPHKIQFHSNTINADSIWWDFGNGKTAGNISDTAIQYSVFNKYTVKLFAKTNSGCLDTAIYTVNVNVVKDSAIVNRDTSICSNNSIQLKAIKGLSYCWSPSTGLSNSFIQNPVAQPLGTTKYYLDILADSTKPVIMDSVTITVMPPPSVNAGNDISICPGDSIQLNAAGGTTYNWNTSASLSDTTISDPFAKLLKTESFIVTGYNASGCSDTDTVKVTVLPLPVINLTNDTAICIGGSVLLNANAQGNNTFNWSPATGLSALNISNPVASPQSETKYFVTVTGANNCAVTDSVFVDVLPLPVIATMNDTNICIKDSIILNTNIANANSIRWTPLTGLNNATIQNPKASPLASTLYTVVAGNGICSEKDSVLISVLPLPNVQTNNDTAVCGNASVQLNASGAVSYTWMPSAGLTDATISDPIASPGTTTTYIVQGIGNNGCANIDSVNISVNSVPQFSVTPNTSLCLGDSVLLVASGGDVYNWSPVQYLSNASSSTTTASPLQDITYSVTIINTVCKTTEVLTSGITVKALPVVTVTKSNDIDCLNFESQLTATGGINYSWFPSTYISGINIPDPVVNPPGDTKYFVTAYDNNGCKDQDSILILSNMNNANLVKFEVANAFTPNNDGVNDCFSVKYWGPTNAFDLSIYNRWGQVVFHSNNVSSCWDGKYKGIPQPVGTYVYVVTASAKCSNGILHKKGTLLLIR